MVRVVLIGVVVVITWSSNSLEQHLSPGLCYVMFIIYRLYFG